MSRLGKNQQFILDALEDEGEPTSVMDLARRQADTEDPDRSVKVSIR